jgi:hypothetical protein
MFCSKHHLSVLTVNTVATLLLGFDFDMLMLPSKIHAIGSQEGTRWWSRQG